VSDHAHDRNRSCIRGSARDDDGDARAHGSRSGRHRDDVHARRVHGDDDGAHDHVHVLRDSSILHARRVRGHVHAYVRVYLYS